MPSTVKDAVGPSDVIDIVDSITTVVGELMYFPKVLGLTIQSDMRKRLCIDVVVRAKPTDPQAWLDQQFLEPTCPLTAMIIVTIDLSDNLVDSNAIFLPHWCVVVAVVVPALSIASCTTALRMIAQISLDDLSRVKAVTKPSRTR